MSNKSNQLISDLSNKVVAELCELLASTYVVYVKTQNFHWNVTGINFISLHKFFSDQYEELAEAIDLIAEQIRMLGSTAPASLSDFIKLSKILDGSKSINPNEMLTELLSAHELLLDCLKRSIEVTKVQQDDLTQDLLINRARSHQKTIWILKQLINN